MKVTMMLSVMGVSLGLFAANRTTVLPNGDTVVVFDEPGDFSWTAPRNISNARVLLVGGGGSGGSTSAGGGGAGQVVYHDGISFVGGTAYFGTVGAGGVGGTSWNRGANGSQTTFLGVVASGGGGGGATGASTASGLAGANSGGSGARNGTFAAQAPTGKTEVDADGWQWLGGHKGGTGHLNVSGGGGGAIGDGEDGVTGADADTALCGDGGPGYGSDITGETVYYACGGGGGAESTGGATATRLATAGKGGSFPNSTAGDGQQVSGAAGLPGLAGTGSGGGGGFRKGSSAGTGGAGGCGTVIVRYAPNAPVLSLSDYSAMADGEAHSIGVEVKFLPEGGTVAYAESSSGPWSDTAPSYATVGIHEVWVKASAEGLDDYLGSAEVRILSEPETEGSVFFVVPAGTAGNTPRAPYTHWSTAANSIQDALDQAKGVAGSQVVIWSGVYCVSARLAVSNTTVRSWVAETGAIDSRAVRLDGLGATAVVDLYKSALRGLTIANGTTGVRASGHATAGQIMLDGCVVSNMTTCALSILDSVSLSVTNTLFACNRGPASTSNNGVPKFFQCVFSNNVSKSSKGMAINNNAAFVADGCDFIGNGINEAGGSTVWGSVISGAGTTAPTIRNCRFIGNFNKQASVGRGMMSFGGAGTVTDCVFSNNEWQIGAGSMKSTFDRCAFYSEKGCLMRADAGGTVSPMMRNCLFVDTTPADYSVGATIPTFENCTFATGGIGSFRSTWQGDRVVLVNCLFASGATYGVTGTGANPMVYATNCCFAGETVLAGGKGHFVSTHPRLVDAANGNYRLKPGSPCRDKGVKLAWMTASATDLDGGARVRDAQGVASEAGIPDIGCYECAEPKAGLMLILR